MDYAVVDDRQAVDAWYARLTQLDGQRAAHQQSCPNLAFTVSFARIPVAMSLRYSAFWLEGLLKTCATQRADLLCDT